VGTVSDTVFGRAHQAGSVLGAAALGAAVLTVVLVGPVSVVSLLATAVGALGVTLGLVRADRRFAGVGVVALLCGVVAAGWVGTAPERLLPATALTLLCWEFGSSSFDRRAELRGGYVSGSELLHVAAATGVGVLGTGIAYGGSRLLEVGVSTVGVILLLVAAVALGMALRD
jgi:hypothetical protein